MSGMWTIAILRFWYATDLMQTCDDLDNAMLSAASLPPASELDNWRARAQIQQYGVFRSGWWVNTCQAMALAMLMVSLGSGAGPKSVVPLYTIVSTLLLLFGDWRLLNGSCDPGVSSCGDARFELGANLCAYPAEKRFLKSTDVPDCYMCDETMRAMATCGAALAAVSVVAAAHL